MKEFIEYLLSQIVNIPEAVKVEEEIQEDDFRVYKITVAPEDMGLVIGKEGRTIKSLRALSRSKAIKDGVRINLELIETGDGPKKPETAEQPVEETL